MPSSFPADILRFNCACSLSNSCIPWLISFLAAKKSRLRHRFLFPLVFSRLTSFRSLSQPYCFQLQPFSAAGCWSNRSLSILASFIISFAFHFHFFTASGSQIVNFPLQFKASPLQFLLITFILFGRNAVRIRVSSIPGDVVQHSSAGWFIVCNSWEKNFNFSSAMIKLLR